MVSKKIKAIFAIFAVGALENLAQLLFLGIQLTKQLVFQSLLFTVLLVLILNQMKVLNDD